MKLIKIINFIIYDIICVSEKKVKACCSIFVISLMLCFVSPQNM